MSNGLTLPFEGSIGQFEDQTAFSVADTAGGDAMSVSANNGTALTAVSSHGNAILAQHGDPAPINPGVDEHTAVFASSAEAIAVLAISRDNDAVRGHSLFKGVVGISRGGTGIQDRTVAPDSDAGVWGESNTARGVIGFSSANDGVLGISTNSAHAGVAGKNVSGTAVIGESNACGVMALCHSGEGSALIAKNEQSGFAARFFGQVSVNDGGLFVDGDITISGNLNIGHSGDVTLADCAEEFDMAEEAVEAGTVVVIDNAGRLRPSSEPYDHRVVGVVAGAGSFKPAIILDRNESRNRTRKPVALFGKVYCKVDAESSPIEAGDLLTSSHIPGYAMRVNDRARALGCVMGKALARLDSGRGMIPVLITLQ